MHTAVRRGAFRHSRRKCAGDYAGGNALGAKRAGDKRRAEREVLTLMSDDAAAVQMYTGLVWNLYSILTPAPILQYFTQYSAPSAPILKP